MENDIESLPVGGRLALDIETVSPQLSEGQRPDFENSAHFQLLATALGYEPPEDGYQDGVSKLTTKVLFRRDTQHDSEVEHIIEVAELIEALDPSQIITYNGERFDLNHLRGRAHISGQRTGRHDGEDAITAALDRPHNDLKPVAWEQFGNYTKLEQIIDKIGHTPRETQFEDYDHGHDLSYRDPDAPEYITSSDVPKLGMCLLEHREGATNGINRNETIRMLRDYAEGDIEHLFNIADTFSGR